MTQGHEYTYTTTPAVLVDIVAATFHDLVISGFRGTELWSVSFQRRPERRIVFSGPPPTAEELMASMAGNATISMLMAECIVTAVMSAKDKP